KSAGPLRWLKAALTGLLPTPPTPVQITKGLSLWLDEKRGSRQKRSDPVRGVFENTRRRTVRPGSFCAGILTAEISFRPVRLR
ncbi:hypothetical protein, partial [Brevundimonas sp.]|uniref:hypothetical protein n=1 Tax=Brevundimonas sp. TaxID=1871086 RepID=UPI0035617A17